MTDPVTTVTALMVRPYSPGMYADLAGGVTETSTTDAASGLTSLTFAAELDGTQVAAVRARMTSRDDDDQAARAVLRADMDALDDGNSLRRLYGYVLGETDAGIT